MKLPIALGLGCLTLTAAVLGWPRRAITQSADVRLTRVAEIEIDPQQIEPYKAALREGIAAAVRLEPGVLSIEALSVKDHPEQVRVFEVYASRAAYEEHLQTPHFKRYKSLTQGMVRSLRLIDADPILLAAKPGAFTLR